MFRREHWKPFLQKAAIEISVVGNHEHHRAQQTINGAIINSLG
jgi:hypothetical protein